ncbi:hypothetical protein [Sporolactobacillus spathodeae]|uniref:Uncharacterized protein n=1 Tax=Sporolactobacillus spathodeae TaxID=1465502 RepID=A0ABS2QAR0_9BACL|nr:hypothetical protein [Sporolactobacillus spathodeae]MBM7658840.1 hypothetical protein [Sporolactobacillus spathodeae]
MLAFVSQLGLCYGIIGLIMSGLLGVLPSSSEWGKLTFPVFLLFMLFWFPLIVLALMAAPFFLLIDRQEDEAY